LIFVATPNRATESLSIPELAVAGFLSAVPTTLITAPVERAKVLLQVLAFGDYMLSTKFTILVFYC
jgi:solute carrier family 25 carnitine/acylcarnitine transporter 20/29